MPVILATEEAEIRRIIVQGQLRQKQVLETSSQTTTKCIGSAHLSSRLHGAQQSHFSPKARLGPRGSEWTSVHTNIFV
jgi:hypothetical protein